MHTDFELQEKGSNRNVPLKCAKTPVDQIIVPQACYYNPFWVGQADNSYSLILFSIEVM